MTKLNAALFLDGYKVHHIFQYLPGTEVIYSNFTPRSGKIAEKIILNYDNKVIMFGLQAVVKKYIIDFWNENFFKLPKQQVLEQYSRYMDSYLGKSAVPVEHIAALHELGYLPIRIKALKEGSKVNIGIPLFTIVNTIPEFYWITNYLETAITTEFWKIVTNTTTSYYFRKLLDKYAFKTGANKEFVNFQGHDFSMRGLSGIHDSSTAGHLLSFYGTDTVPSLYYMEEYYNADLNSLVGTSISATEHSVASTNIFYNRNTPEFEEAKLLFDNEDDENLIAEYIFLKRMLTEVYPTGMFSYVTDTYDFFGVLTKILPKLKDIILNRDGKLVIRPDSGVPNEIICGTKQFREFDSIEEAKRIIIDESWDCDEFEIEYFKCDGRYYQVEIDKDVFNSPEINVVFEINPEPEELGAVEILWNLFGGTVNDFGYKTLNSKVGLVYGDSITFDMADRILWNLYDSGYASDNIVFGLGAFLFNYNTRDTFGMAFKTTYAEVNGVEIDVMKNPKTGSSKKSAKGLLRVEYENGKYVLYENQTKEQEEQGLLELVFENGELKREQTLQEIIELTRVN